MIDLDALQVCNLTIYWNVKLSDDEEFINRFEFVI